MMKIIDIRWNFLLFNNRRCSNFNPILSEKAIVLLDSEKYFKNQSTHDSTPKKGCRKYEQ